MSENPRIHQPICPHCGNDPLRFNMLQGPVPTGEENGSQLLIAQFWCKECRKLVAMQVMGVIMPQPELDPGATDLGAGKKKLWSPS